MDNLRLRNRAGLPAWVWLVVAGGVGAHALADIVGDFIALPAGLVAADSLAEWLAERGIRASGPDGPLGRALVDSLGRPVLGPDGRPVYQRVVNPAGSDGVVDMPGGVPNEAQIVDSDGSPVTQLAPYRGPAPSGTSYGVSPPRVSSTGASGQPSIVQYVNGVRQGAVSFSDAGLSFVDGQLYLEGADGVARNVDGSSLLEEMVDGLKERAVDRVINNLSDSEIDRLLHSRGGGYQASCSCETSGARIASVSVNPSFNPLVAGRNFRRFFGDAVLPPESTPTPVPTPTPTPTPTPGRPPADGGELGDMMWTSWRLESGSGNTNCYTISRNGRAAETVRRLEGTASITSRNGRTWRVEVELHAKSEHEQTGNPLAEGHKIRVEYVANYTGTFSDENPELRFSHKSLQGQICLINPSQTPSSSCTPMDVPELSGSTTRITQSGTRRFHIRATSPGLPALNTDIPKHAT